MRIKVDYERCSGHGLCVFESQGIYTLGEDGYNNTPDMEVAEGQRAAAVSGAAACPERAIHLSE